MKSSSFCDLLSTFVNNSNAILSPVLKNNAIPVFLIIIEFTRVCMVIKWAVKLTTSLYLAIVPVSLIVATIRPIKLSITTHSSLVPIAFVFFSIWPLTHSIAMVLIVGEVTNILSLVHFDFCTMGFIIIFPMTYVRMAISVPISTTTMSLRVLKLTSVPITIGIVHDSTPTWLTFNHLTFIAGAISPLFMSYIAFHCFHYTL